MSYRRWNKMKRQKTNTMPEFKPLHDIQAMYKPNEDIKVNIKTPANKVARIVSLLEANGYTIKKGELRKWI